MGILRTILALSVVLFHAHYAGISLPSEVKFDYDFGGAVAVQCFYIISGFYMALILNEKYLKKKHSLYLFYTNRIYRLIPLYCFFLIGAIALSFYLYKSNISGVPPNTSALFIHGFKMLDISTIIYILFSNIFILGHELSVFLGINPVDGTMFFASNWTKTPYPFVWQFFFIPQSWTIALELYFYILIPFIIKRMRLIIALIVLSFIFRIYLYSHGYNYLFWTYGFFPNEIGMFLLGVMSYSLYSKLKKTELFRKSISLIFLVIILLMTLCYQLLPHNSSFPNFFNNAQIIYYASVFFGLPFVFFVSKQSKVDRFIGELSYPIYLCHLGIIEFFNTKIVSDMGSIKIFYVLLVIIIFSIISVYCIQKNVDNYRQRRVLNKE